MSNQEAVPTDGASLAEFFSTPDGESPFLERYKSFIQDGTHEPIEEEKFEPVYKDADEVQKLQDFHDNHMSQHQALMADQQIVEMIKELK